MMPAELLPKKDSRKLLKDDIPSIRCTEYDVIILPVITLSPCPKSELPIISPVSLLL